MAASTLFRGMETDTRIDTLGISRLYATWCVKEVPMNGSSGISSPTDLSAIQGHGIRLRLTKLEEIGTN
jgi:hypothetical protein